MRRLLPVSPRTWWCICRRSPRDPELSPFHMHRRHLHATVHRVQDAIITKPERDWDMAALASVGNTTERHLLRLFIEHACVSPLHYLRLIRLERARQSLEFGASVTEQPKWRASGRACSFAERGAANGEGHRATRAAPNCRSNPGCVRSRPRGLRANRCWRRCHRVDELAAQSAVRPPDHASGEVEHCRLRRSVVPASEPVSSSRFAHANQPFGISFSTI